MIVQRITILNMAATYRFGDWVLYELLFVFKRPSDTVMPGMGFPDYYWWTFDKRMGRTTNTQPATEIQAHIRS